MTGEQTRARRENQSSGDKAALPDCGTGEFQLRRAHCNRLRRWKQIKEARLIGQNPQSLPVVCPDKKPQRQI
jgi:hypothetical protein